MDNTSTPVSPYPPGFNYSSSALRSGFGVPGYFDNHLLPGSRPLTYQSNYYITANLFVIGMTKRKEPLGQNSDDFLVARERILMISPSAFVFIRIFCDPCNHPVAMHRSVRLSTV
jgi:hypothetical protein